MQLLQKIVACVLLLGFSPAAAAVPYIAHYCSNAGNTRITAAVVGTAECCCPEAVPEVPASCCAESERPLPPAGKHKEQDGCCHTEIATVHVDSSLLVPVPHLERIEYVVLFNLPTPASRILDIHPVREFAIGNPRHAPPEKVGIPVFIQSFLC